MTVHYCLGIQVKQDRDNKRVKLHQGKYLTNFLAKYSVQDCKPAATPIEQSSKLMPNEGKLMKRIIKL